MVTPRARRAPRKKPAMSGARWWSQARFSAIGGSSAHAGGAFPFLSRHIRIRKLRVSSAKAGRVSGGVAMLCRLDCRPGSPLFRAGID